MADHHILIGNALEVLPRLPEGKFRTILADPPWPYRQRLGRGKGGGDTTRGGTPYSTMPIEAIAGLPVEKMAQKDALLGLWATNSHLHEAFHILEVWGFTYKTTVTWGKQHFGLGYWLRGQTEHLLIGVRGSPRSKMKGPHGATGNNWSTLLLARKAEHSRKPEAVYTMLEDIGEPPRLELFARQRRTGWTAWGLEVGGPAQVPLAPAVEVVR